MNVLGGLFGLQTATVACCYQADSTNALERGAEPTYRLARDHVPSLGVVLTYIRAARRLQS